jgi:DNA helicase-2/ATP-dependent DNA helicase PcrA
MDVLAYLRLISIRATTARSTGCRYPRRGIGDTSRTHLLEWAAAAGVSPLEASLRAEEIPALRGGAAGSLCAFAELIQRFTALAAHLRVGELVEKLLDEIKLLDALRDEGPEGDERIENVRELVAGAHEYDARPERAELEAADLQDATPLDLFLQKVSLLTDVDRHDPEAQAVTLMTLHNAKGLEFPYVFISGLEDGLFPLAARSMPEALEEERRLFYVGITRGELKVYFTGPLARQGEEYWAQALQLYGPSWRAPEAGDAGCSGCGSSAKCAGGPARRKAQQLWRRHMPRWRGRSNVSTLRAQEAPRFREASGCAIRSSAEGDRG